MREVARRAGCTHQAPYHYFVNREAVLAELVREGFDELADRLAAAREGVGDADLRAILTASGVAYVEPDVCDFERFPEMVQAGERARNELARMARSMVGGEASLEVEMLFWSSVHGLALLLLDGPLAGEFGSMQERIDFARGVVDLVGVPIVDVFHEDEGMA